MNNENGLSTVFYFTLQPTTPVKGDVNFNGTVLADGILATMVLSGMTPSGIQPAADVNADGKIGLEEAIHILQIAREVRNSKHL